MRNPDGRPVHGNGDDPAPETNEDINDYLIQDPGDDGRPYLSWVRRPSSGR